MLKLHKYGLILALVLASAGARAALGQGAPPIVRDEARLFSPEAARKAAVRLGELEREGRLATRIESVTSLKGEPIAEASLRLTNRMDREGLHILIAKDEHKIEIHATRRLLPSFPEGRFGTIRDAFIAGMKENQPDKALADGVEAIVKTALALPLPPTHARAVGPALVVRNQSRLTLGGARMIVAAAEAKAAELKLKENIAVVDEGGHLLAFARMDGARPASGYTAITKATSAATFRQETGPIPKGTTNPDPLLNLSLQNAATASGGKLTTLQGGIPIVIDDQVIGAIGVGGGTGEQDAQVARAAVEAFLNAVKESTPEDVIPL